MKTSLASFIMPFPVFALAQPFLICDPPNPAENVTHYDIMVDNEIVVENVLAQTDGSLKFGVINYVNTGQHLFTARAKNAWGVSEWADPLDENTSGPSAISGLGVIGE